MSKKNLHLKLNRFASHLLEPSPQTQPLPPLPSRYKKLADHTGGELISQPEGAFCIINTFYPLSYEHGRYHLHDCNKPSQPRAAFCLDDDKHQIENTSLLFIDTETTGLGGSGTVPFLIGCGSVTPKGFEIRQYLLPDYADETAMLESLRKEFSNDKTIVSYNGAAFDMPLLLDRFIVNRLTRDIPQKEHMDLLHSVRRLYKRRMKNCRLAQVEEALLEFSRTEDIPGFLVPSIYFEWLNNESLDYMRHVLEHNRLDIISLYFLYHLIGDFYEANGENSTKVDDLHSLAKLFHRQNKPSAGEEVYHKILRLEENLSPDILIFHAMTYKRQKKWGTALPIFELLSERQGKEAYLANIELAKYYEHTQKDYLRAMDYTQKAAHNCPSKSRLKTAVDLRLIRLARKNHLP